MQRITAFDWACPNIQRANWLYTDVQAAASSSCWQVGHLLLVCCLVTSFLTSSLPWTESGGNRQLGVLQGQSRWSTPGLDFARWLTTLLARCVKSTCLGNCSPAPCSTSFSNLSQFHFFGRFFEVSKVQSACISEVANFPCCASSVWHLIFWLTWIEDNNHMNFIKTCSILTWQ